MANFVMPVSRLQPVENRVIEFKGLNRKDYVEEGEMSDMLNLTSDKYPYLVQRKLRGSYALPAGVLRPLQIICKFSKIAMIALKTDESIAFYYDGTEIPEITGLSEGSQMVAINTKICFFPNKTYVEVTRSGGVDGSTYGSLECSQLLSSTAVTIGNEDVRIPVQAGHDFAYDDAINLTGTLVYDSADSGTQSKTIEASCWIEDVAGNVLVLPRETFIELTGEGATNVSFSGTIGRTAPDLDLVIEWNNRLWGASNEDNTVYACKLGDPKNWQYFQGTSMDSYYAQQGTDEDFTGVGAYSGHIMFFKPSSMCRIYGTAPSNYQITNTQCYGVEDGSRRSVVTINDRVFYKSKIGIMAYDGSVPYSISEKFNCEFRNVIGGTEGTKYYASCQVANGGYELMVLDVEKAVWHKEDGLRFRGCCTADNVLHVIEYEDELMYCADDLMCDDYLVIGSNDIEGSIRTINPVAPDETYDSMAWMATFGPFDEYVENRKIYSRMSIRLNVFSESTVTVSIREDSGPWELVKTFSPAETCGELIPIIPRRCDRYSIRIEGTGKCEIKSLTRRYRKGSHGKL